MFSYSLLAPVVPLPTARCCPQARVDPLGGCHIRRGAASGERQGEPPAGRKNLLVKAALFSFSFFFPFHRVSYKVLVVTSSSKIFILSPPLTLSLLFYYSSAWKATSSGNEDHWIGIFASYLCRPRLLASISHSFVSVLLDIPDLSSACYASKANMRI